MDHWCTIHNCKFFKNEKNGTTWYSHKTDDPNFTKGYHNEPKEEQSTTQTTQTSQPKANDTYFTCNALNNTVALIVGGKVEYKDLEATYKQLLSVLQSQ